MTVLPRLDQLLTASPLKLAPVLLGGSMLTTSPIIALPREFIATDSGNSTNLTATNDRVEQEPFNLPPDPNNPLSGLETLKELREHPPDAQADRMPVGPRNNEDKQASKLKLKVVSLLFIAAVAVLLAWGDLSRRRNRKVNDESS